MTNTTDKVEEKRQRLISRLGQEWYDILGKEFDEDYMLLLGHFLAERRKEVYVYPKADDMFNAFKLTSFSDVKVVILGQDPYHTPDVAHGLAFSSDDPFYTPPSLETIFHEIERDIYRGLNVGMMAETNLTRWAEQGILLLNSILTVEKGTPLSHDGKGWKRFTSRAIQALYKEHRSIVWVLWGKKAQEHFEKSIKGLPANLEQMILTAAHPAAESYVAPGGPSAGFNGCEHFSQINDFLKQHYGKEIRW